MPKVLDKFWSWGFHSVPGSILWLSSLWFSTVIYILIFIHFRIIQPDLDEHILYSNDIPDKFRFSGHPLFFVLIQVFSGFSKVFKVQVWAATFIFSCAQLAKLMLTYRLINVVFQTKVNHIQFLLILLVQLVISFSVFDKNFIINQLSPNYFHNGTLNISIPFALWLFTEAVLYIRNSEAIHFRRMLIAGLFIILAKPSFLFCFIPIFPVYMFVRFGFSKKLVGALRVDAFFLALLIWQSIYLLLLPKSPGKSFSIDFKPFFLFGSWEGHATTLLYGMAIPLFALIVFGIKAFRHHILAFTLAMLALGYLFAFTMVDTVNGIISPNMTWQVPIVLYILLVLLIGQVFNREFKASRWKLAVFAVFIGLNATYGLHYLKVAAMVRSFFI